MKKASFEKLQEKYAAENLLVGEMDKVKGGCADFSDVQGGVSSTDTIVDFGSS